MTRTAPTRPTSPSYAASLLVLPSAAPPSERVTGLRRGDRTGTLQRTFPDADSFTPVVEVPPGAYTLVDVERGDEFRGVRPGEALAELERRGRTPLTIAEGLTWIEATPATLEPNHCFHVAGSRGGDRRVPALWLSKGAPTLGWCWEGNHHTWLGLASAALRRAVD